MLSGHPRGACLFTKQGYTGCWAVQQCWAVQHAAYLGVQYTCCVPLLAMMWFSGVVLAWSLWRVGWR
jgi:hypothetical protein